METNRPFIFVIGTSKSGTTWLCRLIADMYDSPIGTVHSPSESDIFVGHAVEGIAREGPFIIRHGHAIPEKLRPIVRPEDSVIFIQRDPRDIAVSRSHYFKRSLDECIRDILYGRPNARGAMNRPLIDYVYRWLQSDLLTMDVKYEQLHDDPFTILSDVQYMTEVPALKTLDDVVYRQSFDVRRQWTQEHGDSLGLGKEYHLKFLRKGIVGDWHNHFTPEQKQLVMDVIGDFMREMEYL